VRILLVEDADILRRLLGRMLKRHGFEVREASDGLAALGCLADFHPELVLTNMRMPRLDGLGLIRRLRAMPEMDAVPVLAMTAVASFEDEVEARRAGAAEFLDKPLNSGGTLLDCLDGYR
jgi:two-component system chemotaxis response regulator CheY